MRTYIIAEAACEHLGNMNRAVRLIENAKTVGADCVKFQLFDPEVACDGNYNLERILRQCYLSPKKFGQLRDITLGMGLNFLLSVFSETDIDIAHEIYPEQVKIPSGRSHNIKILKYATKMFRLVFCSFGMMTTAEIEVIRNQLLPHEMERIVPMFCVSAYPTSNEDAALGELVRSSFYQGYSAHTQDSEIILSATAIGQTRRRFVLEFHITTVLNGPDHLVSFRELEAIDLIRRVRKQDDMFSKTRAEPLECEKKILWRRQ